MRLSVPFVVLAVAACSGSTPTGVKPTTTPSSSSTFDTLLTGGSIPTGGGTVTVHKAGDALNGLTLTLPPGAFSGTLNLTIGSSSNQHVPTANGIVAISPLVHIVSNASDYADAAITITVPAKVPANMYPVFVMYDSATQAMEPMTTTAYDSTSVTVVTSHLSNANMLQLASGARVARRSAISTKDAGGGSVLIAGVLAIPQSLLDQDFDTGFRPGTNDWEMQAVATEGTNNTVTDFGAVTTEVWYYTAKPSSKPLYGQFPIVSNVPWSDRVGYYWVTAVTRDQFNRYNDFARSSADVQTGQSQPDRTQFNLIRAAWALAASAHGTPQPAPLILHDAQTKNAITILVAYKSIGDKIYVDDPFRPGDATRFVQLGSLSMNPYVIGSSQFRQPLAVGLGVVVPPSELSSTYSQVADGTLDNAYFPASKFYSWLGQLYDTIYVVDTLRTWAQCNNCGAGFATTLSPRPGGFVEKGLNIYKLANGRAVDSIGSLGADGILAENIPPGQVTTYGIPLVSAAVTNEPTVNGQIGTFRWLDWHQFILVELQTTIAPAAPQVAPNSPLALQLSVTPQMLPRDVAYQWDFGDKSGVVTVQNNANVQHTYTDIGTYNVTAKIVDNRNTQVIALATTPVTVGSKPEVWLIQSLAYLYTIKNGVQGHNDSTSNHGYVIFLDSNAVHTLVALDGPPLPAANYPAGVGFYLAQPPDSAQHWASVQGTPLALAGAFTPLNVVAYADSGNKASGTITGKAQSTTLTGGSPATPLGYSINLTKNGNTLSGYIQFQGTGMDQNGGTITEMTVDTVVAQRVQ